MIKFKRNMISAKKEYLIIPNAKQYHSVSVNRLLSSSL